MPPTLTITDQTTESPVAFSAIPVRGIFVIAPGGVPLLKVSDTQVFDLVNGTLSGDPSVPVYARAAALVLTRPVA